MRKNFNEQARFEQILEEGFAVDYYYKPNKLITSSGDWPQTICDMDIHYTTGLGDLNILIKRLCAQGLKPKAIKEKVKELWLNYSPLRDAGVIDRQIRKIRYKKDYFLPNITSVSVPKELIDYVIDLPNKSNLKLNRPIKRASQNLFFVLYIWSMIQKECHKKYYMNINLDNDERRLKRTANVKGHIADSVGPLIDAGIVDIPMNTRSYEFKILIDEFEGEKCIEVDPLDPLKTLVEYLGEEKKLHACPRCGKMIEGRAGSFCEDCKREKERLKKQKQRAKKGE